MLFRTFMRSTGVQSSSRFCTCLFLVFAIVTILSIGTLQHHVDNLQIYVTRYGSKGGLGNVNIEETKMVDSNNSLIPNKIWQIIVQDGQCNPEYLQKTKTWLAKNINYDYNLMGKTKSDEFVQKHYAHEPRVLRVYNSLVNKGMKSDFLRYLILNIEGGVYADIDTEAIRSVDEWIPPYLRNRVRFVAGIEFDLLGAPLLKGMRHSVQFGQWAFGGAPGHPVFRRTIDRAVQGVEDLAAMHGVSVADVRPSKATEVTNSTGPLAFTDAIFGELRRVDPSYHETNTLSPMLGNVMVGDMLLLPIDAFGMGQRHSGSTNDGSIPKNSLVVHHFWRDWTRGDQLTDDGKDKKGSGQLGEAKGESGS